MSGKQKRDKRLKALYGRTRDAMAQNALDRSRERIVHPAKPRVPNQFEILFRKDHHERHKGKPFLSTNLELVPRGCYKGGGCVDTSKHAQLQKDFARLSAKKLGKRAPILGQSKFTGKSHSFRNRDKSKELSGDFQTNLHERVDCFARKIGHDLPLEQGWPFGNEKRNFSYTDFARYSKSDLMRPSSSQLITFRGKFKPPCKHITRDESFPPKYGVFHAVFPSDKSSWSERPRTAPA